MSANPQSIGKAESSQFGTNLLAEIISNLVKTSGDKQHKIHVMARLGVSSEARVASRVSELIDRQFRAGKSLRDRCFDDLLDKEVTKCDQTIDQLSDLDLTPKDCNLEIATNQSRFFGSDRNIKCLL